VINGEVVSREEIIDTTNVLRIFMEQEGCQIEVVVPTETLPDAMYMKEYMQNTAVDMYARLRFMVLNAQHANQKQH
jgi:hypothetical protein